MNRLLKVLFICVLIISLNGIKAFASDLSVIEDTLNEIGLPQDYSDNIIDYIDNISLSETELDVLVEEGSNIINDIGERRSLSEFKFSELVTLYSDVNRIANEFNLSLGYNFTDKEVKVTDKDTKAILFKGSLQDIKTYYSNLANIKDNIDINELQNLVLTEIANNNANLDAKNNSETTITSAEDTVTGKLAEKDNKKLDNRKGNNSPVNVIKNSLVATSENYEFDFITLIFAILVAAIFTLLFKILFSKKTT